MSQMEFLVWKIDLEVRILWNYNFIVDKEMSIGNWKTVRI